MFGFGSDKGETRSFEYEDEYTVGRSGRVRKKCHPDLGAESRLVLAEALYETAERLERDAGELRRRGRAIVEGVGHCGECHTSRDRFGGLLEDQWLAGAPNRGSMSAFTTFASAPVDMSFVAIASRWVKRRPSPLPPLTPSYSMMTSARA